MHTDVLDVDTARRRIVDLTESVRAFCFPQGDGLCNVFVPHATAGVAIIETGAGSDDDLVDTLEWLLPRDDRYRHAHGSAGHGADHVLPAIIETGAGSDDDLVDTLERLLPRDDRYRHAHGSHGHGADHVLPAIVAPSITLPVEGGEPQLGTWQSVVLVDTNTDNPDRQVRLSFVADASAQLA